MLHDAVVLAGGRDDLLRLRRRCASRASRRRRPCRPGRPRSSAACASGSAWRWRSRRCPCPRASAGRRCTRSPSSCPWTRGPSTWRRCGTRRRRTAPRPRRSACSEKALTWLDATAAQADDAHPDRLVGALHASNRRPACHHGGTHQEMSSVHAFVPGGYSAQAAESRPRARGAFRPLPVWVSGQVHSATALAEIDKSDTAFRKPTKLGRARPDASRAPLPPQRAQNARRGPPLPHQRAQKRPGTPSLQRRRGPS